MKYCLLLVVLLATVMMPAHGQQSIGDTLHVEVADTLASDMLKSAAPPFRAQWQQPVRMGVSLSLAVGSSMLLKKVVSERRPDKTDSRSFPSNHAALAFAAARVVDREWGWNKGHKWVSLAAYGAATAVGAQRVIADRHYTHDVVAGALLGIASVEVGYWLIRLVFK